MTYGRELMSPQTVLDHLEIFSFAANRDVLQPLPSLKCKIECLNVSTDTEVGVL